MSAQPGKRRSLRSVLGSGNGSSRSLFFNRFWVTTAIAVSVLGVALDDRGITLLGILVAGAAGVTWGWNRVSLSRLRYSCTIAERRHFPGDATEVRVEIVNDKPLPVPWVSIDIELSDALRLPDRETTPSGITGRRNVQFRTRLGPYERVVWRIPVVCQARGLQTIGPATIRAGDPLGFFSNRIDLPEEASIIVYPRIARLPPFQLPPRHAVGDVRVPRQLLVDPLRVVGIRDYRPEDPFKAIHWKASARQGRLQVRVLEPTTSLQLAIFANIDTFEHYWEGLDVGASEQAIELAASLAVWGLDNRYAVSVASNGIVAGSDQAMRVPSGRGVDQRRQVLETLAKLSPYSSTSFIPILHAGSGRLAPGTTVVVITSLLPEGLTERMRALIAAGQRVVLIPVADCPQPALQGLIVRRMAAAADVSPSEQPEMAAGD